MNPASFNFELLNSLKFKELQKLSIKFNVNKRWAKKQELIENLLRLKPCVETPKEDEWINGSLVFSNGKKVFNGENIENEPATNIINNQNGNVIDRRLTFTISQNVYDSASESQQNNTKTKISNSSLCEHSKITESNATFEISSDIINFDEASSNEKSNENPTLLFKNSYVPLPNKSGTFYKKGINLVPTSSKTVKRDVTKHKKLTDINSMKELSSLKSSFSKIEDLGNKNMLNQHSIKLSKPIKSSTSKIPKKCISNNIPITQKSSIPLKKNLFASAFESKYVAEKKFEDQIHTLSTPAYKKTKAFVPSQLTPLNRNSNGIKNGFQTSNLKHRSQQNHLLPKKMPDFKKIHEKQFEKMDSIVDYLKKKEERSKKLIKGSDLKMNKSVQLFDNKTDISLPKKNGSSENKKLLETKKSAFARAIQKENVKTTFHVLKNRTEDIRDKNRKLIQGVRTNKRFELQMKLRNV